MKKSTKTLIIVIVAVIVCVFAVYRFFAGKYNTMVALDEEVKGKWAQVENQYQRRADLIPNLVATVKGYAAHEEQLFTEIADARSKAGGVVSIDSSIIDDEEKFSRYQQVQDSLGSSLQRLLAVTENYPELQANENFLSLQDQLEGTENRIATERRNFNESAKKYNTFIRQFPNSFIASSGGFFPKAYFSSAAGANEAPRVEF